MARYRNKPVEVEARRVPTWDTKITVVGFVGECIELAEWCGGTSHMMSPPPDILKGIHIKTLEGTMVASPGDWIICGVKGEFYPCKTDIFEATYDEVGM